MLKLEPSNQSCYRQDAQRCCNCWCLHAPTGGPVVPLVLHHLLHRSHCKKVVAPPLKARETRTSWEAVQDLLSHMNDILSHHEPFVAGLYPLVGS